MGLGDWARYPVVSVVLSLWEEEWGIRGLVDSLLMGGRFGGAQGLVRFRMVRREERSAPCKEVGG